MDEMISGGSLNYPRVLVISHNCFSRTNSNGRTLANFFIKWPKKSLAQFYISSEVPDSPVCDNYFRVLDTETLKAFYKGSRVGRVINSEMNTDGLGEKDASLHTLYKRHRKKTPFNYIVRNLIWDSNRWRSKEFEKWVEEFTPDVVLLQVGDYAFTFKIALNIAKERNIPLVLYNSEDYYFKDRKLLSLLYHFYRFQYKRQFEKLMAYASHTIYICDMLQETYRKRFKHQSTVIMTAAEITPRKTRNKNGHFIISYLGNLGIGRHEPLIEIAKTLQNIDKNLRIDIYGKIPNEAVAAAFQACAGINYKGFVNYEEVLRVMQNSDLLVHAENFSEFYQWDLKHAFSTKVADSLASGTCFFVYGPESIASVRYLKDNQAACVVTQPEKLESALEKLISNYDLRMSYVKRALALANEKHNSEKNSRILERLLADILEVKRNTDESITSKLRL